MEFVFKPEKIASEFIDQVAEALAKRTELYSRKKLPGIWEKTDELNRKNLSEKGFKRRIRLRKFYGIILILCGIFLFVPGIMKPAELTVPLIVGAFSLIYGISAVIPRKTPEERFSKKAKKLVSAINNSIKPEDTEFFNEEGIFENGSLLMEYNNLEDVIETKDFWIFCDGKLIMILNKNNLISGAKEEFSAFIEEKTKKKTVNC